MRMLAKKNNSKVHIFLLQNPLLLYTMFGLTPIMLPACHLEGTATPLTAENHPSLQT